MTSTDLTPTVRLRPVGDDAGWQDGLAADVGDRVGLDGALGDLNRRAQAWAAPVRFLAEGYRWDRADMRDREWYPQGVTTSADASPDADTYDGRRIAAVAWYAKRVDDAPSRGSRVSFLDITDRAAPRYRHVLLVDRAPDGPIRPVRLHAGGIVWLGPMMLVADTHGGMRVFDLAEILRVDPSAHDGYGYLLPQRLAYRAENADGAEPFRFSFVAVDRTSSGPQLVVGEYATGQKSRRLMTLAVDESNPRAPLRLTDGVVVPTAVEDGVRQMQGALIIDGRRYASVGRGVHWRGSMWTWGPGESPHEHRASLAVGPEDLSYWPQRDEIWSASEEPGRRFVYAVHRSAFDR
jgi:hypothetical protein